MKKRWYLVLFVAFAVVTTVTISFSFVSKVKLFNHEYNITTEYLDLSHIKINDSNDWFPILSRFILLKEINLGNNILKKEDKEQLINMYPKVNIKAIGKFDLCGSEVLDNTERLDLSTYNINCDISEHLLKFINLKEVDFGSQIIDKELQAKLLNKYPNINFSFIVDVFGRKYSNQVMSLDLSNLIIDDFSELVKIISYFPNLRSIDLSNSSLTNDQLAELRTIYPNIEIDWVVYFGQWHLRTDTIAFSVLIKDFSHTRLTTNDIQVLKYCTKLQALDLGHQAIQDISVIGDYLKDLRILILADNQITDISPLAKLQHLHYLELFMNKITDISPLKELTGLVDINLSHNAKLKNIEPLMNLPKLERLWLVYSNDIDSNSINRLKQQYPYSSIYNGGYESTGGGWRSHPRYRALINSFKNNRVDELFTKYD